MSYNFNVESKKYNRRIDPQSASEDDFSGYIKFKTELYEREKWFDENLWETFTYYFEKFNLDNWKMAEKEILQSLRKTLRSAGVHVNKDEVVVWDALNEMTTTTKFSPWTEDQIKKSLRDKSFNFTSGKIQWLLENNFGRQESYNTLESAKIQIETCKLEESELPKTQNLLLPEKQLYDQQPNYLADIGRQSGNLSKIYTENMKYSGENDSFTYKLMIFNDNCSRAGVTRENFSKVFPTMLKSLAFDYYYASIGAMPQKSEGICKMFEEYFEGKEYKRGVLNK
ncbi:hypothetical protein GcC1_201029 [Golovinomyces cichoracearum]|uniref:Integrase and RNaseH domain-containing protein n=1 Tax=Golovinomyces cichoracearum TaxID=62708 RepID=A0A420HE88_9PEZI|nr:hypothetical protein GcC1_201029 [Golovinomyces cichoracearum]